MVDHSSDRVESILCEAVELPSEDARRRFIEEACRGDRPLQQRVELLIENHLRAGSFLETPAGDRPAATVDLCGTSLGPYKLLEPIGEGGFGVVYMAEQRHPVRRLVALKILKAGVDTAQVVTRFEAERQALALMNHPNIAQVLDGGVTDAGRHYFVMELVQGLPITRYCDEQRLPPRERLALLISVCEAVQHAHQKGIVHRDLKPSNILVASYDGRAVPKVIDFGVAKALGPQLTERTLVTNFGGILGTLEYMSPEQAEFNALDVDTRADIYSLGVLMYELLTGTTPLTQQRVRQAALTEVLRLIREEEAPTPSMRLSGTRASQQSVSTPRPLDPNRLTKEIRGELDWIVMKCLEKERHRRYQSASGLARDLQRYLQGEPVEAAPPSVGYRMRKFVRRHRAAVLATTLVFLSLLGGILGTAWALADATRQKRLAQAAQHKESLAKLREQERADAEVHERQRAEMAEAEGAAVIDFLRNDLIGQAGSLAQAQRQFRPNPDLTIRAALDRAAAAVGEKFQDNPILEAAIRKTLGDSYLQLGLYDKAIEQLEQAVDLRVQQLGSDDSNTLHARDSLAQAYRGATRFAEAIELLEQNVASRTRQLGPDQPVTLITRDNLAVAYRDAGRAADALAQFEQVRDAKLDVFGPNDPSTLTTLHNLASMYMDGGQTTEAITALEQVYAAKARVLGPEHPETLPALQNLAVAYWKAKRLDQSIPRFELLLELYRKVYGDKHPTTLGAVANLGVNQRDAGQLAVAIATLEEARAGAVGHASLTWVAPELSIAYERAGHLDKAAALEKVLLAERRASLDSESPELATALANTGSTLLRLKAWTDAETVLRECVERRERQEPDAWRTFSTKSLLGQALLGQAKFAEAETWLLEGSRGLSDRESSIPQGAKFRMTDALHRLVQLYEAWDKPEQAAQWRETLNRSLAVPPGN